MVTGNMQTSEWLEDLEIRSEYGAATLKYDIAAVLVAARKIENLTQAALANIAGVSQAYIAKLESGEANPTIGRIGAILAAMWLKSRVSLVSLKKSSEDALGEIPLALKETATRGDKQSKGIPPSILESSQRSKVTSFEHYLGSKNNTMRTKPDEAISYLAR